MLPKKLVTRHYCFCKPLIMNNSCGYVCLFSLLAPKENRRKEMRFAAAQIPAKIGVRSLNGENLMYSTSFRTSSGSSPFLTLVHHRFLYAVLCKAAWLRTCAVFLKMKVYKHSPRRGDISITPYKAERSDAAVWGVRCHVRQSAARAVDTKEWGG